MKIYKDGEYADGENCINCKTKDGVFYDKELDFFICSKCLYEKKDRENNVRK